MKGSYNNALKNINRLPETHRDMMMRLYGFYGEPQTADEIADYCNSIHLNVETWQVEALIEEGMQMARTDIPLVKREEARSFHVNLYHENCREEEQDLVNMGFIPIYSSSISCEMPGREAYANLTLLVKNPAGLENLGEIMLRDEDDWIARMLNERDLNFVLDHGEGLLLGDSLTWYDINQLLYEEEKGTDIKSYLATCYEHIDFIRMPYLGILFGYQDADFESANSEVKKERQGKIREMGKKAAYIFEELGKPVIYQLDTYDAKTEYIYDYIYLGEDLARKTVLGNPNKIAETLEIIQPSNPALKPFLQLAVK
ncbi:hypothetical protein SAMN02910369_00025 [Lachnospiraceae bacterium NE2001]|nr:hypothetical protein SAMN02910369_00025 [Lachnospiraceae bacterium NE2001]